MKPPTSHDLEPQPGEGLHPALWPAPRLKYPAGLPSDSWIPAHKWQPPTRERMELSKQQRLALRDLRRQIRAGLTLEQVKPRSRGGAYGRAWKGWMMAHQIAQVMRVSPWDALDFEVARTQGRVEWYDEKIGTATADEELVGRGALAPYVRDQRWEREHLVKTAKMLIDAGLAAHITAQVDADVTAMAGVLLGTLEELGLPEEVIDRARSIMRRRVLALDSDAGTIEGEWSQEDAQEDVSPRT